MKQISILSLLLCLCVGFAKAATLSGVVTNAGTTNPVANQKIFIEDTLSNYYDSTLTDAAGAYSFTLPTAVTSSDPIFVWTTACTVYYRNFHFFTGASIVSNFSVCGSSSFQLHGLVSLGSTANNGLAKVYLIRAAYNPTLMDTVLTAIDSITTAATGGSFSKTYASIPSGQLLLKAALLPSHPSYANFLPTYFGWSLNWSGATPLTNYNFSPSGTTVVNMIPGTNPGGPGFIGGSVLLGANKTTAVGDPLNNRLLLLTTASGTAVAYTYSDGNGKFSFPNLAYGTYKIFGDALGLTNPPLTVTISAATPTVGNIVFEENNKTFKGSFGLSVASSKALAAIRIVPNPASGFVVLSGMASINGSKVVTVRNLTGAIVATMNIASGKEPMIETGSLPAGVYILQIQSEEGNGNYQFVKQ